MCGIAGIFSYSSDAADVGLHELCAIRDSMAARGPDGMGIWLAPDHRIGFGHRRLAIIDLSENGAQPMISGGQNLVITFNGEIYNYRELRDQLIAQGYVFRSHSDTEVLLALYEKKGEDMVHELRGMFAFAIWDSEKRGVFLARDPYGIKPLYYADDRKRFVFASQVKALLEGGSMVGGPDPAGWVGYYLLGSVPEPFSTFTMVRALEAGSTLWVDHRGAQPPKQYFSIGSAYIEAGQQEPTHVSDEEIQRRIRHELIDSVRHHLVSDVPVGAFLSAGIDSSTLVGLMWELGHKDIQTITIAFQEFEGNLNDESRLSALIADRYGANHTRRLVTEEEFRDDLPKIMIAMDQPTIDGINAWFAAKAAKELGLKVVISGLGGDELFNGYPSFHSIPSWMRAARLLAPLPFVRDMLRKAVAAFNQRRIRLHPKTGEILHYVNSIEGSYLLCRGLFMPSELDTLLDADFVAEGLHRLQIFDRLAEALSPPVRSTTAAIATLEASFYMRNQLLRDSDWASMAHGVEVRVPLVDVKLLTRLGGVLEGGTAHNWKRCLAASPKLPLPTSVVDRSKTGFETPVARWLQNDTRLGHWKGGRGLDRPGTPWARRWAYEVAVNQCSAWSRCTA